MSVDIQQLRAEHGPFGQDVFELPTREEIVALDDQSVLSSSIEHALPLWDISLRDRRRLAAYLWAQGWRLHGVEGDQ